jgi:superfamily I DNA and RNA helicase
MKNIQVKLVESSNTFITFITRYRITLFIVITGIVLAIMLIDISMLSDANPTENEIAEAEKSVKIIKFKDESVQVINSLKANNVQIETLFDPNRYDPFN